TRVRRDTNEIYSRLDDEQSERRLLAGRLNMLFRDRRAHAYTRHLIETEARLSREAWTAAAYTDIDSDAVTTEISNPTTRTGDHTTRTCDHTTGTGDSPTGTCDSLTRIGYRTTGTARTRWSLLSITGSIPASKALDYDVSESLRSTADQETTNTTSVTNAQLHVMIEQGVTAALAARDDLRSKNGDDSHNSGTGVRRTERSTRECTYTDFLKCQPLHFKGTEGVASLSQWFERMESVFHISNCAVENQAKFATCTLHSVALTWWNTHEMALLCERMFPEEFDKIERYIGGLPDMIHGSVVASKPRHFKRDCPKLNNKNGGNGNAQGWVYDVGNAERNRNAAGNPDSNVVTGTFLLNNRYAYILFDTGADRSFVSIAFSSLIDIIPTQLDNHYDVELADGKIVRINTIIQGCILNLLNHPFTIDLMPVELGSFDVIICMDWLRRHHAMIVCDEKLVRVPFGNKTLVFRGAECYIRRESRLTIISCSKVQEYRAKGCHVYLAQISATKEDDKSKGKQVKDVPIVQDFPEVFPEDLPGLPPARPVEFQIDLIPGATPVARAPYRLAPFKMKELSKQLQELSDKGFI
nr:putative reverse transcriptase domain-containing protein [Tanacetum cinerariifolium]